MIFNKENLLDLIEFMRDVSIKHDMTCTKLHEMSEGTATLEEQSDFINFKNNMHRLDVVSNHFIKELHNPETMVCKLTESNNLN